MDPGLAAHHGAKGGAAQHPESAVIARSAATKQSSLASWLLDCFAALAMTASLRD
jgi:hypothetical protein